MQTTTTPRQPPRAWLYFVRDGNLVRYPLGNSRTLIGRGVNNDLILEDPSVATHHAVVLARPDGHYLSTACELAPRVNGMPAYKTLRLEDGDVVEIGGVHVKVAQPHGASRPPVQLGVLAGDHHPRFALFDGVETWLGACHGELTRTSHHHSAAAWDPPAPSPRAPCGSLDVLQVRLRLPPVRATAKPLAPPGASLEAGEKSGLSVHDRRPAGVRCYLEHAAPGVLFATPLSRGVWIDGRPARGRTRVGDGSVIDLGVGRVALRLLSAVLEAA